MAGDEAPGGDLAEQHEGCVLAIDLTGVDLYLETPGKVPGGAQLVTGSVTDLEGEWDLVMFHHSFEHVPEPGETLLHVSKRLRPGGWCLIRVPTVSSFAWEHYREDWVQLDAPRHFFLHSLESMRLLAEHSGMVLDQVRYDSGSFQFWASEQYIRDLPLRTDESKGARRIFTRREIRRFERQAEQLNRQGRGAVLEGEEAARVLDMLRDDAERCYADYEEMLNEDRDGGLLDENRLGLARELARMNLTLNTYTQWYWKIDLHNLLHFLSLRADAHAQYEIRVYADAMLETVRRWVPLTCEAFTNYRMGGLQLSSRGLDVVKKLVAGQPVVQEQSGLSKREWRELMAVLGREE